MRRFLMATVLAAAALPVLAAAGSASIRAASAAPVVSRSAPSQTTVLYRGGLRVGQIDGGGGGWFCNCGDGAEIVLNRAQTWIRVSSGSFSDYTIGYAHRVSAGKWAIGKAGFAVRRTPTYWDALEGSRRVGYARGPAGPEGVAALLLVCDGV